MTRWLRVGSGAIGLGLLAGTAVLCQTPAAKSAPDQTVVAAAAQPVDADQAQAQEMIGRAVILRGFYQANELSYDVAGKVEGSPKVTDWTLAAMEVQKVVRKATGKIELDGVHVAIRYNQDQHIFERHPQKDDKMQVTVADTGDAKSFAAALKAIFSIGIDPELQREMPDYWLHYFIPGAPWPQDGLAGKTIFGTNGQPLPDDATKATPDKKVEPKFTSYALRDHVKGAIEVRLDVDEEGTPRRVSVLLPLGYGLDGKVVDAVKQWRFRPAMRAGTPIPSVEVVNQTFDYANLSPQ
jgi:TonB family protein